MMNNFLKDELEAEIKMASKHKHVVFAVIVSSLFILIVGGTTAFAWVQGQANHRKNTEMPTVINDLPIPVESKTDNAPTTKSPEVQTSVTSNTTQTTQPQSTSQQSYTPPTVSIDRDKFLSDGNKVMAHYSQIVDLLNFGSISDSEKTNRIKQAVALDRQYFSQVTDLRANLVWANISDGPYMEAVELAESGVSKISVGLGSLGEWADDHSTLYNYSTGMGMITQGTNILLDFSNRLGSL